MFTYQCKPSIRITETENDTTSLVFGQAIITILTTKSPAVDHVAVVFRKHGD